MNWTYHRPGINDLVRKPDGSYAPQMLLTSPYSSQFLGSSPATRLSPENCFDKMQTARTQYVVQGTDISSPFISGQFSVNWDDQFADTNYTVVCTLEDPNFSPPDSFVLVGLVQK